MSPARFAIKRVTVSTSGVGSRTDEPMAKPPDTVIAGMARRLLGALPQKRAPTTLRSYRKAQKGAEDAIRNHEIEGVGRLSQRGVYKVMLERHRAHVEALR